MARRAAYLSDYRDMSRDSDRGLRESRDGKRGSSRKHDPKPCIYAPMLRILAIFHLRPLILKRFAELTMERRQA